MPTGRTSSPSLEKSADRMEGDTRMSDLDWFTLALAMARTAPRAGLLACTALLSDICLEARAIVAAWVG
jgi:hypothetical protein